MKGRRPRPLDDGGLVDRTGSVFFIPSFEPPLVYDRFAEARKPFCSILPDFDPHFRPFIAWHIFKLVNEDSEKLQKILKFLHNTPNQGILEGF